MEEGFWGGEAGLGATPWLPGNCGRSPVLPICSVPTHPPGQASPPTPAQPRDYQGLESPWGYGEERGFRVSPRAEQEATCDLTRMARDSSWRRGQARARRCRNAFLSQPPPEMERWVAARLTESPRPSTQPHPTPRSAAHRRARGPRGRAAGESPDRPGSPLTPAGAQGPTAPARRSVLQGRRGVPLCGVPSRSRSSAHPRPAPRPRAHSWQGRAPQREV